MPIRFSNTSIRIKLILINSFGAVLALCLVSSVMVCYTYFTGKQHTEQNLSELADLIAWNNGSGLAITDTKTGRENLRLLKIRPEIVAAFLYYPDGKVFADYRNDSWVDKDLPVSPVIKQFTTQQTIPSASNISSQNNRIRQWYEAWFQVSHPHRTIAGQMEVVSYEHHGQLHLLRPIVKDGKVLGVLHLVEHLQQFNDSFRQFCLVTFASVALGLVLVVWGAHYLQTFFSRPLREVIQAIQKITRDNDADLRLPLDRQDEFAELADACNRLLNQIQQHQADDESQLQQRTAELHEKTIALEEAIADAKTANCVKSQFLANISHEFRTPINAVLGMSELLQKGIERGEQQSQIIDTINQSSHALLEIINNILDFSNLASGKMQLGAQAFDIQELVTESFNKLSDQAHGKGLNYQLHFNGSSYIVKGDPLRLSQILINLLNNAIKFSPQGNVYLKVNTQLMEEGWLKLTCTVSDQGIGIDALKQQTLFDAFSQADESMTRQYGGTGLGLAITKHLVRLMGGNIGVISEPDKGSSFWFHVLLPVSELAAEPELSKDSCSFNASVLVVEDYSSNQLLVKHFLNEFGCRVDLANNGEEAVQLFVLNQYDLIFMDCQMPIMDGYQATQAIRRIEAQRPEKSHVPIIALTSQALTDDHNNCMAVGMDEWIIKPFTRQRLNHALQKFLSVNKFSH